MNNNSDTQIIETLTSVGEKIRRLASQEKISDQKRLLYQNALGKVEGAIAALDKLNSDDSPIENLPQPSQPKKSLMAKLKEIKIEGEPDWSQRCNGEIL